MLKAALWVSDFLWRLGAFGLLFSVLLYAINRVVLDIRPTCDWHGKQVFGAEYLGAYLILAGLVVGVAAIVANEIAAWRRGHE
jgi:hypothetical protein